MKKLLLLLVFSTICISTQAQWGCYNWVTFDSVSVFLSLNIPYPLAITIDTTNYHHNIWQVGAPHKTVFTSAYSLPNAIITDTLNPYPPNDTSVFVLKMPKEIEPFSQLIDIHFYFELDKDTDAIAKVEISGDSGLHWVNIADSLPSNYSWDGDTTHLSSSTTGWTEFSLNRCVVCPGEDDTILFRFTFISGNDATTKDGWIIDNINVNYWCEAGVMPLKNTDLISIFPNPATTQLTIRSANEPINDVVITNLLGQVVCSKHGSTSLTMTSAIGSLQCFVDVSLLPNGVYFVRVNGDVIRKFVKE